MCSNGWGIDSVDQAQSWSTLDIGSGHSKVECDERNCSKTTFKSHQRLCFIITMLFCRKNIPSLFQYAMYEIQFKGRRQFAFVFVDDFGFSQINLGTLYPSSFCFQLISLLSDGRVSLKLNKFFSFHDRVYYLCHVLNLGKSSFWTGQQMTCMDWSHQQMWHNWQQSLASVT